MIYCFTLPSCRDEEQRKEGDREENKKKINEINASSVAFSTSIMKMLGYKNQTIVFQSSKKKKESVECRGSHRSGVENSVADV